MISECAIDIVWMTMMTTTMMVMKRLLKLQTSSLTIIDMTVVSQLASVNEY